MRVVQSVAGVRVFERADGPVLVATIAVARRFRKVIRIAVTPAARQSFVVELERPPRPVVRKLNGFRFHVTLIAAHLRVTGIADAVQSFFAVANGRGGLLGFRMTRRAAFSMMARCTRDAVFLGVISVKQRDNRSAAIGRMPDLLFRFDESGESASGRTLRQRMCRRLLSLLQVADFAGRVVTPILMAAKTLPMIGTFQARLFEIFVGDVRGMTIFAGGDAADLLEVVTILTSAIHRGHFRMQAMRKTDGFVLILEFVDEHFIRPHLQILRGDARSRADTEARVVRRRCPADVTLRAAIGRAGLLRDGFGALAGEHKRKTGDK